MVYALHLVWGWVAFAASMPDRIYSEACSWMQSIIGVADVIVGVAFLFLPELQKDGRKNKVTTYVGESIKYLWMEWSVRLFCIEHDTF